MKHYCNLSKDTDRLYLFVDKLNKAWLEKNLKGRERKREIERERRRETNHMYCVVREVE
jgi:hypothetical protein